MTEKKESEYGDGLSLYHAQKKRKVTMNAEDREFWKKVKVDYEKCPHRNAESYCDWSIRFRTMGPFFCFGRAYRRCSVYMRMQKGEDPVALIT